VIEYQLKTISEILSDITTGVDYAEEVTLKLQGGRLNVLIGVLANHKQELESALQAVAKSY